MKIPPADGTQDIPGHLAVMRSWVGTKEVPGPAANPIIAGTPTSWASLVDRPDVTSDEVANCAMAVGAAIVAAACQKAGVTEADIIAASKETPRRGAIALLKEKGIDVVLPARDQRLIARSYCPFGVDASNDPRPGDIMVIPRGKAWQGHVMYLNRDLGNGIWECIGANQGNETSYARHRLSQAVPGAIRRYVPPTIKDLRVAGSTAIKRGDQLELAGGVLTVGAPAVAAVNNALAPAADVAAKMPLQEVADSTTLVHTLTSTGTAIGNLFVANPWLVGCIGVGLFVFWLGRTGKLNRLAQHIAGVPLSIAALAQEFLPEPQPDAEPIPA